MDSCIFQTEIGHAAFSTSTKIMGPYDTVLYILIGVLVGLILIMKFCEIVYQRVVRKEILENNENSGKMENVYELIIVVNNSNLKLLAIWDLLHTFVLFLNHRPLTASNFNSYTYPHA